MTTVLSPPDARVVLNRISWETYERLISEHGEQCGTRFAYDGESLDIKVVSLEHERLNRLLADIFKDIADEWGVDYVNAGSTTFKRESLRKGFEPDTGFYIRDAERVRDNKEIDLEIDPPPELVIEIDITHPSFDRLPIFAAVGVSEVWRCDGADVHILILQDDDYVEVSESLVLPGVTGARLSQLLTDGQRMKPGEWRRTVRKWAMENKR